MKIEFDLQWRIGREEPLTFDPLLFELLAGIRDGGSLRSAATAAGVSYRHAWGLLERWELVFGQPLAALSRGRGAALTTIGEKLLWAEGRIQAKLGPELESLAAEIGNELDSLLSNDNIEPLHIFASHGLAIGIFKQLANQQPVLSLNLQYRGSLESLRLLKAKRCDIAGFHIPQGELRQQLRAQYKPWLLPGYQLVHVVKRTQGLLITTGNPKNIHGLDDLTRTDMRFINRQPGSGTRVLFDQLLHNAGISSEYVPGYETEEFTHLAVAALVASGAADCGFGIGAAASKMQLDFLPLVREDYFFCLPKSILDSTTTRAVLEVLRSEAFKTRVNALQGYDATASGTLVSIDSVLT